MTLLRIREVASQGAYVLRLVLTDGTEIERDVSSLLTGPVFEGLRRDPSLFHQVQAEAGTVVWPNGADLDPDVLIWGGPPPKESAARPPGKLQPGSGANAA